MSAPAFAAVAAASAVGIFKLMDKDNNTNVLFVVQPKTDSEDWEVCKIKHILSTDKDNLKVGPFGSQLSGTDFSTEGYWVYNQRTVLDYNFETNNTYVNYVKYEEMQGFQVMTRNRAKKFRPFEKNIMSLRRRKNEEKLQKREKGKKDHPRLTHCGETGTFSGRSKRSVNDHFA